MKWPRAVDLFCGAGGLSQGLRDARYRVLGAIDSDPLAMATYRLNHKNTRTWQANIRTVNPAELLEALGLAPGELELLAGCPPCQGFSAMRTRNGHHEIKDPQNDLVFQFARFARVIKPRALMMENVPGLASDARMTTMREELVDLGYVLVDAVLNVAHYGVPQRRRRYILLALRDSKPDLAQPLDEQLSVREAIKSLPTPGTSGDPVHDTLERRSEKIQTLIRAIPRDGGSRSDRPASDQLDCHRRSNGWKDVYGRMAWDSPAPTITGGCVNPSKGRFLHPDQDRAITLREAALLQGFPSDYRFSLKDGKFAAAQLIGNALPPPFAKCHASSLRRRLVTNGIGRSARPSARARAPRE